MKKFDVILTNPPYQNSNSEASSGKLWGKFYKKVHDLTTDDGYYAAISPNSWTKGEVSPRGNGKILKMITSNQPIKIVNRDVGEHFPGIGVTFSYAVVQKTPAHTTTTVTQNHETIDVDLSTCRFIPRDIRMLDAVHRFYSHPAFDNFLITNTRNPNIAFDDNGSIQIVTNGNIKLASSCPYDSDPKVIIPWANPFTKIRSGKIIAGNTCLVFPCEDHQTKNLHDIFNSKLYQYMNEQLKMAAHNEACRLFPKVDIDRAWTDAELYAHFGLTDEEIEIVEQSFR